MVLARWKVVELCKPTSLLSSASPIPSRWRATSSRIAKARPSDCTPTRWRSSASSSISGCDGSTSRAMAGFSIVLLLVRGLNGLTPHSLVVEQHHTLFGHIADRIARTLAADAAVLDAAIGELVGAPGRTTIDDHLSLIHI